MKRVGGEAGGVCAGGGAGGGGGVGCRERSFMGRPFFAWFAHIWLLTPRHQATKSTKTTFGWTRRNTTTTTLLWARRGVLFHALVHPHEDAVLHVGGEVVVVPGLVEAEFI